MSSLGNKEIMAGNIKYYLDKNKMSQKDLCQALGFRETTFSEWTNAKSYPRIDKIEAMADYFHINKSDLIEKRIEDYRADKREIEEYVNEVFSRPELRVLFSMSKKATKEQVEQVVEIFKVIKKAGGSEE